MRCIGCDMCVCYMCVYRSYARTLYRVLGYMVHGIGYRVNYFTRRFLMSDGGGVGGEYDGEDDEGVIPAEGELFVECFGEAIVDVDS